MIRNTRKNILVRSLIGLIALYSATAVCALDPQKAVTQYVNNVWTSSDGLPQDSVNAITQTSDGYLWIATQEGLARFDGIKFTVFDSSSNIDKFGGFVFDLLAARDGTLWIGTGGGMFSYKDGNFKRYSSTDGLPDVSMKHLTESADGTLLLGTATTDRLVGGHGLTFFKDGQITTLKSQDGLSNDQVAGTFFDRRGRLWIATANGLNLYEDGKFKVYTTADGLSDNHIRTILEDREGSLWVGTSNGLNRIKDGIIAKFTTADGLSNNIIYSTCEDRDGNIWIGTEKGLNRITSGQLQAVTGIESLTNDQILSIYEDREGSLWIGTHVKGLIRLRDAKFTTYGAAEGLQGENVQSIFQDSKGRIWIDTTDGGLNVLENNRFKLYTTENGLSNSRVRAIYEDRADNLLFGTFGGLNKFENGKFSSYTPGNSPVKDIIRVIYEDTDGSLFIGTSTSLLWFKNKILKTYARADGLLGGGVNFIHRTRSGQLYIAGDENMSILEDSKLKPQYKDFPSETNAQSIAEDADGTLWIVTWGQGLYRLKDGKVTNYTTKNGLYDNTAWSILEDDSGYLWMGCNRGIFRVSKQELNDFADGKIKSVSSIVYDSANGMRKRETNAGAPGAIRASDGRLWFATTSGVVVVDPNHLETNPVAPPVVIERLSADDQSMIPGGQEYEIEADVKNIEFDYVGLSFISSERVKYKYKIEGFDNDWVEAGGRRSAFYTNLAPGEYVFKVIAANAAGVWNEQGAHLKFRILAPFWRTRWFFYLAILCFVGIAFLLYRWRIRYLQRANAGQILFSRQLIASQENERKRIAAELHDNLGQHLIIIKNWASLGLKFTEESAPSRKQLTEISATAMQAIDEVREIIYDLRPVQLETSGLSRTLKFMIEQAAASSDINFIADCAELDGLFSPEDEVIIYRAVQECVSNIIKHSQAKNAEITIRCSGQKIEIKITDDGTGFVPETVSKSDERGGLGLVSLNERVRMLGGTLDIQSSAGNGSMILIEIPVLPK